MAHRPPPHIGPTPTSESDSARPGPIGRWASGQASSQYRTDPDLDERRDRTPHPRRVLRGPGRGDRTETEDILKEFREGPSPLADLPEAARATPGSRAYDAQLARQAIKSTAGQQARAKAMLAEADRLQEEADAKLAREKERLAGLRFQPLGVPEPEIPHLVQLKINKLRSNAAMLLRGEEPFSLPAAYQNLTETAAATFAVTLTRAVPGWTPEIEGRANELESQGYSKIQAARMAYLASDLPTTNILIPGEFVSPFLMALGVTDKPVTVPVGLKGALQLAVEPVNALPGIGYGGALLKLGKLRKLASATAGAVRQAEVANLSKAVVRRLNRIDTSTREAIKQTAKLAKVAADPRITAPGISRRGPIPRISGGADADDIRTVRGLNQTIKLLDKDIKGIEKRWGAIGGVADRLVDERRALSEYREHVLESALGEDDYRAYLKLRKDLDEVRAIEQAGRGTGSGLAPPKGTEARARWDYRRDERMAAIEAREGAYAERPRESITALKEGIDYFENLADQIGRVEDALPPPGTDRYAPLTQRGTLQTGMDIGEPTPQGALFDETPIGGEVGPLADAEQLASLQAAREAVWQAKLPGRLAGKFGPNYNMGHLKYRPKFDSDVDRALFIVAKAGSKMDESYMGWLRELFPDLSDRELRAAGGKVSEHINTTVRGQPEGAVAIPLSPVVRELGVRPTAAAAGAPPAVPVTPGMPSAEAEEALRKAVQDVTGGTPPTINGVPTGEVIPPSHVVDAKDARRKLGAVFDAIEGSPTHFSATRLWKTGDWEQFVDDVRRSRSDKAQPTLEGLPEPPTKGIEIAEEFAEQPLDRLSQFDAMTTNRGRLLEQMDFGKFNRAAQKFIGRPTDRMEQASWRWGAEQIFKIREVLDRHGMLGSPGSLGLRKRATEIAELVNTEAAGKSAQALLGVEEIASKLSGLPSADQLRIVATAQEARLWYDDIFKMINDIRAARGQRLIPYRENYVQWIHEQNAWNRFGFQEMRHTDLADMPDLIHPKQVLNPRELQREARVLRPDHLENDLMKLMAGYSESARRDIFYTEIIQNVRAHTRALRQRPGMKTTADVLDNWVSETYAGTETLLDQWVAKISPRIKIGRLGLDAAEAIYGTQRSLMRSVFPANLPWSLVMQTSSIVPTFAKFGTGNTIRGLSYIFNPAVRKAVRERSHTVASKLRSRGGPQFQDVAQASDRVSSLERSPMETVTDWVSFLSKAIEDGLTGVSDQAAYLDGVTRLGLTGDDAAAFGARGSSTTQSMYSRGDMPGALRSRALKTVIPFHTFVFEMFGNAREYGLLGPWLRTGLYQTVASDSLAGRAVLSRRIKMGLTWIAGMYVVNLVGEAAINRKPWQVGSFLPFYSLITGSMFPDGGRKGIRTIPSDYASGLTGGVMDFLKTGKWQSLRQWVLRWHMLAGTQVNRFLDGLEAASEGAVKTPSGRTLFEVDPGDDPVEWLRLLLVGPYNGTPEGREHIDKLRKRDGAFAEFIGPAGLFFEAAQPVSGRLAKMEKMIGEKVMRDDGGETDFTTKDFGALVREKVVELGRFWDKPSAMQQSSQDGDALWKEYDTINEDKKEKERIAWRREHPETDASLFFWGRVKTLQSKEALDLVTEMMTRFDVPENGVEGYDRERVLRPYYDAGQDKMAFFPGRVKRMWEAFQAAGPFEQAQMRREGHPWSKNILRIEGLITKERKALRNLNPDLDAAVIIYGLSKAFETPRGALTLLSLLDKERKEREEAKKRDEEERDEEELDKKLDPAVLAGAK
jgi:hypothetical protein